MTETLTGPAALTRLAEDEVLFRDSVYEFADKEIRPLSREMDEHAKMPRELIDQLFDLVQVGVPERIGLISQVSNHCAEAGAHGREHEKR